MARGRGTRLSKTWIGETASGITSVTATQVMLIFTGISEATLGSTTLLRSRGNVLCVATPDAAGDSDVLGLGLIVVHSNARVAGGVSLPGPINDDGADWLWHQYVPLHSGGITSTTGDNIGSNVRIEIDSKAMRRVPTDHDIVLMAEVADGDFATVAVNAGVRFLFGQ